MEEDGRAGPSKEAGSNVDTAPEEMNAQDNRPPVIIPFINGPRRWYNCARCLNHRINSSLRGHKKDCPYSKCQCDMCFNVLWRQRHKKDCQCSQCINFLLRQRIMAVQLALKKQRKIG